MSTEKTAKGLIKEQENEEDEGLNSQSRESWFENGHEDLSYDLM